MPEEPIEELKEPVLEIDIRAADVKVEFPSGRKKSAYGLFLGRCLPKKPSDVPTPEYLGICNLLWKDVPDNEKAEYQKLAESLSNPEEEENEESK